MHNLKNSISTKADHCKSAKKNNNQPSQSWMRLEKVFNQHFHKPDLQAIRAVYASYAAHDLCGQPVWPLLVGPPGSLKTVLLMSLEGLASTHIIATVTPKTFISGFVADNDHLCITKPSGLLFKIGLSGKIIIPDFSTILSMNRDHRGVVLSDLRRIYDGMLRKEFGNEMAENPVDRVWRGRITVLAAGTGDIDHYYSVFGSLGERFILIRWPRAGYEAAQRAVKQDTDRVTKEVAAVVKSLFDNLNTVSPTIPADMEHKQIPALGDFIGFCRTQVRRNSRGNRDIISVPESESATRISQQLCQLAKGSALLDRRSTVNAEDWQLVKRVAFDCLPPSRRRVIDALIQWPTPAATKAATDALSALPKTTQRYASEELAALGVLTESGAFSRRSMETLKLAEINIAGSK